MKRALKLESLMAMIAKHLDQGRYLDTRHATDRQREREITRPELLHVLRNGHHEKGKDRYDEHYGAWNYAVRGRTIDHKELRIIVSFDPSGMLIITAIDLAR